MEFGIRLATFQFLCHTSYSLSLLAEFKHQSRENPVGPHLAFRTSSKVNQLSDRFLAFARPARNVLMSIMNEGPKKQPSPPAVTSKKSFIHPGFETGAVYGLGFGVSFESDPKIIQF
jgi:hypothetical protein